MSRRTILLAATSAWLACRSATEPVTIGSPGNREVALRIRIAQAEARRGGGVAELAPLATQGPVAQRVLALRALGRIGATAAGAAGPPPLATLLGALADPDPAIVGAAAGALGVAGSLDDGELGATEALIQALPRGGALTIEALGRAGTAAAQPALIRALSEPGLAEVAALALARHGRRKLALSDAARAALVAATAGSDPAVRYAAVYALAREHQPPGDPAATTALIQRLGDPVAEVRAQAIAGLGRRKAVAAARAQGARLDAVLLDRDWRVAVEAVRALGDTDDGKDAIAAALGRRYAELIAGAPAAAQIVIEGEKALAGAADRPVVGPVLAQLAAADTAATLPALTRGWIQCLAISATLHGRAGAELTAALRCGLPSELRLPLVAELVTAGTGTLAARRAALAELLGHADPRVRAAGLGALPALWKAGEASDRRTAGEAVDGAPAAPDRFVASAAVDAASQLYDAIGDGDHAALDAAVIARATTERDPELGSALVELVGKRGLAGGAAACQAALAGDAVLARAAAACLAALHVAAPAVVAVPPPAPPVDVASVIGHRVRWHVQTSRGELVIALQPDVAPWAVATIVGLTRKGFYDGLAFHRVVPDFVVQGGDPSETGSGGPGFAIPAEPGTLADGAGYTAGGVGIADAGRDSGGSQWFVMHSRAPHLDGRYTWFGTLETGQAIADALLIGDRVVHATIELAP